MMMWNVSIELKCKTRILHHILIEFNFLVNITKKKKSKWCIVLYKCVFVNLPSKKKKKNVVI